MSGKYFAFEMGTRRRGFAAAAGSIAGLSVIFGAPLLLAGCGSGGSTISASSSVPTSGLGRAAAVIGTYKGTQTLATGEVEETTFEFTPGSTFETVGGSFSRRVLAAGTSAYVSFSSGTLTGNVLPSGALHVALTVDADSASTESRSVAGRKSSRQAGGNDYQFTINGSGNISGSDGFVLSRTSPVSTTYLANSIAGSWTGGPTTQGGLQVLDPRDNSIIGGLTSMSIQYDLAGNKSGQDYNAAVTLTNPTNGTAYTASGVHARIYSQYDVNLPTVNGLQSIAADQYFVVANGKLPTTAGSLTLPNVPVPISLAGRAFLYEAGVGTDSGSRLQLGALYVKVEKTELLYSLLPLANIDPSATGGYIQVGYFEVFNGKTSTPSPSPSPSPTATPTAGQPAVGTVQFSNVTTTNAITTTITKSEAAASFLGNFLSASLTESDNTTATRVLSIQIGSTADDSSLAAGKTYPITTDTISTGKATVSYIQEGANQKFWDATGGSVVILAHDKTTTTLRVINATMTPLNNYGSTDLPTGTFTINAVGKF